MDYWTAYHMGMRDPRAAGGGTTNYEALSNKPSINDTKLSGNKTAADLGLVSAESGKGLSENNFTDTLKNKLDGIESGAQANVIERVNVNGTALSIASKAVNLLIAAGALNGAISVNGVDVAVKGLADLAYKSEVSMSDLSAALQAVINAKAEASDVNALIGNDTGKSIRTIAVEELAAQLIPETAQESLDTLQEISAWIQSHPNEVAAINRKLTLGTDNGTEYPTVKAYVEAVAAGLTQNISGKVDAVPGKGLSDNNFTDADKLNLDTAKEDSEEALELIDNLLSGLPALVYKHFVAANGALSLHSIYGEVDDIKVPASYAGQTMYVARITPCFSYTPDKRLIFAKSLPATGYLSDMYLVLDTSDASGNLYKRYVWLNNAFTQSGTVRFTLSDTKTETAFSASNYGYTSVVFTKTQPVAENMTASTVYLVNDTTDDSGTLFDEYMLIDGARFHSGKTRLELKQSVIDNLLSDIVLDADAKITYDPSPYIQSAVVAADGSVDVTVSLTNNEYVIVVTTTNLVSAIANKSEPVTCAPVIFSCRCTRRTNELLSNAGFPTMSEAEYANAIGYQLTYEEITGSPDDVFLNTKNAIFITDGTTYYEIRTRPSTLPGSDTFYTAKYTRLSQ